MKMFYQQFLAFFLMITITLLTLGMTFWGFLVPCFIRILGTDYKIMLMRSRLKQWTSDREKIRKSLSTRKTCDYGTDKLSGRHIKIRIYTEPDKLIFPDSKKATTKISSQCWSKLKRGQSVRAKRAIRKDFSRTQIVS